MSDVDTLLEHYLVFYQEAPSQRSIRQSTQVFTIWSGCSISFKNSSMEYKAPRISPFSRDIWSLVCLLCAAVSCSYSQEGTSRSCLPTQSICTVESREIRKWLAILVLLQLAPDSGDWWLPNFIIIFWKLKYITLFIRIYSIYITLNIIVRSCWWLSIRVRSLCRWDPSKLEVAASVALVYRLRWSKASVWAATFNNPVIIQRAP